MPALAEIDLGTLTPEQAAAVGALHAEIGVLKDRNAAQAERIRRLEHIRVASSRCLHTLYNVPMSKCAADRTMDSGWGLFEV